MKQKLLKGFYFFISFLGFFRLFYWLNRNKNIVLTYHNIIPDHLFDNSVHLGVSHRESVFEEHIKLISLRFPKDKVLITFDDGYKNQFKIAPKILENYGLRGIFFIAFQLIVDKTPLVIDKITLWLSYVPIGKYQVAGIQFIITEKNRCEIASMIYTALLSNHLLWDTIENQLNHNFAFEHLKINPALKELRFDSIQENDLLELISRGHAVAAHSWDHKPLATLPLEKQRQDFINCKKYADKYCNSRLYSYPYGGKEEVSLMTMKLCKEYGFSAAFTNNHSLICEEEDVNFQIPRISLPNLDVSHILDAKLSGFESFCKNTIKYLRR